MKNILLINEKINNFEKKLIDLKSLPYNEFINQLLVNVKSQEFLESFGTLVRNKGLAEDFGKYKTKFLQVDTLVPTQSQIGLTETLSWLSDKSSISNIIVGEKADVFANNRILVANNKWILDGHHRWSYVYMLNPEASIPCININLPGKKPEEIIKDLQMTLAYTYKDLYVRPNPIKYNLSRLEDKSILPNLMKLISDDEMLLLRKSYGDTDLKKFILREFIVPEFLYEQRVINSNDFIIKDEDTTLPDDPEIKKLDDTDNDNPDLEKLESDIESSQSGDIDNLQTGLDFAGAVDPTGIVDVLNGLGYLYRGEYLLAICSFVSAIPLGDIVAKPVMVVLKNKALRQIIQKLGRCLKTFDAKNAAKIWLELEKKTPSFGGLIEFLINSMDIILKKFQKIVEVIGDHWLKFKIFYYLFSGKIKKFFEEL